MADGSYPVRGGFSIDFLIEKKRFLVKSDFMLLKSKHKGR